jgi:mannose-6-phosphate isomerase-like protein (cupin superfamily)
LKHLERIQRLFRRVLYTGKNLQLVVMALKPGEEIGEEVHEDRDQFFRIEEGEGSAYRYWNLPNNRSSVQGMRVVRELCRGV